MLAFEGSAGGVLELSINAATNRFFSSSERAPGLFFQATIVSVRFIHYPTCNGLQMSLSSAAIASCMPRIVP
jgi:hypothetical protein